jgi:hypothetical protein
MRGLAIGLVVATLSTAGPDTPRINKQDADRFQQKLSRIVEAGAKPRQKGAKPTSVQVTDSEVTSYLRLNAGDKVPVGIVEPVIAALGNGRVSGNAIVDLDAVRKQKQRGWLDPMAYLTGRLPVTATGTLSTKDGIGRFQLESAEVSGVPVSKSLLQELLTYYSRSAEKPNGINMDDPFELPAQIREIKVSTGNATVIQ